MRLKSVESNATWNERKADKSFARVSGLRSGGREGSCLEARPAYAASRVHALVQMIFRRREKGRNQITGEKTEMRAGGDVMWEELKLDRHPNLSKILKAVVKKEDAL